ncbi:hypothetical protein DES40_1095 [Litorimonas taeanensis]|uniref:Uncharacterized protein n=1 Tax=Litorimonas taeanensis TaxID=568099 RepID=A0A420WLL0_9PROT|nr:hypothetical protein [Litorimonas taeanensis]RKQ71765.1 hypothetical protein DES40_1095 [Litorimonas taeanensis]
MRQNLRKRSVILMGVMGALMMGQTASALSCAMPDLAQKMEEAKASDTVYHIFVGKFRTITHGINPPKPLDTYQDSYGAPHQGIPPHQAPQPPKIQRAFFEGFSLGPNRRYDVPLSGLPVDMEIGCAGPWCGSAPSSEQTHIAFVEARNGRPPLLRVSACPNWVFQTEPNDGKVRKLRQCYDKTCQSEGRPRHR